MFGSSNTNDQKSKNKKTSTQSLSSSSTNMLVRGTYVEGSISTESDIRIDGKMSGKLSSKGKVIIGPSGEITGDIECQNAMIEGQFSGNLLVHELLQVKETAKVEGDVTTKKLIVQSGSVFNVTCNMSGQTVKKRKDKLELEELSQPVQKSA